MPRYFFHVVNGGFVPDQIGTECADTDEVKALAVKSAGEMLTDQGRRLWQTGRWDMFVCDEQNKTLLKLSFDADDLTGKVSSNQR